MATAKKTVTLHGMPISPAVQVALISSLESGVNVRLVRVAPMKGEGKLPSYLALNPFGKIPSLVDNGPTDGPVVLFESIAIAKYVAMTYAPGTLVPASVMDQVKLEQIMQVEANYITANLFKAVSPLFRFELGMAPSVDMKAVAEALDHADILTGVVFLEAALAASAATGPPFLVGNAMTLAECAIFPFFNWFQYMYSLKEEYGAVLTASKLGNFLKSSDKYPHLRLWWAALKARPSSQLIFREALAMLDVMRNKEEFFTELEYEL